jgi:hypothetical protein
MRIANPLPDVAGIADATISARARLSPMELPRSHHIRAGRVYPHTAPIARTLA